MRKLTPHLEGKLPSSRYIVYSIYPLLLFVLPHFANAQNDSLSYVYQDAIENAVSNNDDNPFDYDTEFEHLQDFAEHPININKASQAEFEGLRLLTDKQIKDILDHRAKNGDFIVIYELQSVLDLTTIKKLLPFVMCKGDLNDYQVPVNQWFMRGKHSIITRFARQLEREKPFRKLPTEGGYWGDANRLYARYRYSFGNRVSYGFTLDKDAGEKYNIDFYSFHFKINNLSKTLKIICLGDYSLSIGQGLIHFNGFNMGKSAVVLGIEKEQPPLRQYTSANEANFMRGAAFHFDLGKNIPLLRGAKSADAVVFFSYRRRDGNIASPLLPDPTDEKNVITALQFTGLHRTENELADKNTVGILTFGGILKKNTKRGHIALNSVFNKAEKSLMPRYEPYNQYVLRGKSLMNISSDYNYTYQNFHFFGETAFSNGNLFGYGALNGLLLGLDKKLSISILQRYFSLKYQALNAQPFAESSRTNDENGLYVGLEYKINRHWTTSIYADIWRYQWLKFKADAPSYGREFFAKLTYRTKITEGYIQVRLKTKEENATRADSHKVNRLVEKNRLQIRVNYLYHVHRYLELRNRLEWSFYHADKNNSKGFVAWQDVILHAFNFKKNKKMGMSGRVVFFDTNDYASAIYGYENDLMYNFTVLPYYGQGLRYYLNFNVHLTKNITTEMRFSKTNYTRKPLSQEFSKLTDIKCQLNIHF